MTNLIHLVHATKQATLPQILNEGLRASSSFDDLSLDMRRGVVYCWLCVDDDKMHKDDAGFVYVEVAVEPGRCVVADMEWSSMALMYRQGQAKPVNDEAARLLAELYRVTSTPWTLYRPGMFWTPEVLVKGDISPNAIRLLDTDRQ